jgi:hypothetical protein
MHRYPMKAGRRLRGQDNQKEAEQHTRCDLTLGDSIGSTNPDGFSVHTLASGPTFGKEKSKSCGFCHSTKQRNDPELFSRSTLF